MLPAHKSHRLLVGALIFEKQHLGIMLSEIGRHKRRIYDTLQAEISCALRGALLVQQVQEHATKLEVVNKELNDFAYVVLHDLKTPLRGITRLASWIVDDYARCLDEKGKKCSI